MKKFVFLFSVATIIMGLMFTVPTFAGQGDNVLSENIKEADGTTGQDTNIGSGVKTGHIQDGAVTSGKIADGTVSASDIADGAVTDAKITGPISSSKISSSGLDADTVDGSHASDFASTIHNHDNVYQKKYAKVAVVAQSGGDYTNPITAINDLNSWCGTPSSSNPCLLKIMPGIYDIGTNPLDLISPYVALEGSGERITKIIGSIDGELSGVVIGAVIRSITVENIGGGTYSNAIYTNGAQEISNVTAIASGGIANIGIFNSYGAPAITNVTAYASGGVNNDAIYNYFSGGKMVDIEATASDGTSTNHGILNWRSSPLMLDIEASVSGAATENIAIKNIDFEGLMMNIIATASGGNYSVGIYSSGQNNISSVTIKNAVISASGGTTNYGIMNTGTKSVTFRTDHATITGSTASIWHGIGTFISLVGNSSLEGGSVTGGGTFTCAGIYDENYVFYANTCP